MKSWLANIWKEYRLLLILVLLMICFRSAFADWNTVPTGSMKPNILEGDRVFVNKIAYDIRIPFTSVSLKQLGHPERFEIVTIASKSAETTLIKRVIGLPGDTVQMVANHLIINGKQSTYRIIGEDEKSFLVEETIEDKSHTIKVSKTIEYASSFGPITVPEGNYLVLGDNRDDSADSRVHGFIPRTEIRGRSNRIVLSLDYNHFYLPRPSRFFIPLI